MIGKLLKRVNLMNKIKLFFKATYSRLFNHMADYEDAYDEGWAAGQEEGIKDGWTAGKSDAEKLWKYLYEFLEQRNLLPDDGETNSFDMIESLHQWEKDLKETKKIRENAWRPIEAAPKDRLILLGLFPHSGFIYMPRKVGGWWNNKWNIFGATWEPTHWMELPEPPDA